MLLFSFSLFLSLFLFIYLFIFALGKREGGEEEEEKHIENRKIGKEGRKRKTWRRRRRRKRKIIDTVFSHGFWGWSIIRPFGCPPPHLSGGFPLSLPPSSLLLPSLPLPLHLLGFHSFISFYMYLFICLFYTFSWGPGKHTPFYLNGDWIEWSSPAAMIGVSISRESHGASGIRILKVSPTTPNPPPPPSARLWSYQRRCCWLAELLRRFWFISRWVDVPPRRYLRFLRLSSDPASESLAEIDGPHRPVSLSLSLSLFCLFLFFQVYLVFFLSLSLFSEI